MTPVILAAGQSERFGSENKLFAELFGKTVLDHAIEHASVLGDVCLIREPSPTMGASLAKIPDLTKADVAVFLGDMPLVTELSILRLVRTFAGLSKTRLVRPSFGGKVGFPLLIPESRVPDLRALATEDRGQGFIQKHKAQLTLLPVSDRGTLWDIDTQDDLNTMIRTPWVKSRLLDAKINLSSRPSFDR